KIRKREEEDPSDSRLTISGQMKSGLEVAPAALNELLPQVSSYPVLTPAQLAALKTDELDAAFNTEAVARLEMKGKDEETGSVWVFPEVRLHRVDLQVPEEVDAAGQVTRTRTETVHFPRPSSVHFYGEKTK
ncbi:MAG TPA: hypothetical protein VHK69_02735, partial [Chitinophagaceae bacterium]|nr:hypothetical protein [Chitinophagaceae bacterium]